MRSCISSGCREAARALQKDTFAQLLSEEVVFRCRAEKRSMVLREPRVREAWTYQYVYPNSELGKIL